MLGDMLGRKVNSGYHSELNIYVYACLFCVYVDITIDIFDVNVVS